MTMLTNALDTEFTPAIGDFIVQCSGGPVNLLRKSAAAAAAFAYAGPLASGEAKTVQNPVAGAIYKFTAIVGTPTVRADQ